MTYKYDKNIGSKLKRVEKNHSDMEKQSRIIEKYQKSLSNYKNKYNMGYMDIFERPYEHFYVFQNRVYYTVLRLELNENNLCVLFEKLQLPYNVNDDNIKTLTSSLKDILKILKPLKYYDYVYQYKIKYNINSCFLDKPEVYFKIIDNNLCYINNTVSALTDSYVLEIFKNHNLPAPTYNERKKIFSSLMKMALDAHENKNTIQYENPYYINYSVKLKSGIRLTGTRAKSLYTEPIDISIEYCKNNKTFIHREHLYDPNFIYKRVPITEESINPSASYYPKYFSKVLCTLTNGDITIINNLSEVFACILSEKNICNKLTVFCVSDQQYLLAHLLGIIVGFKVSTMSLKAICDSKNIKKLINMKLDGTFLNLSIDSSLPDIEKAGILNKIVNSKPISAKDSFLGKKTFINNMYLVYITNKNANIIKLSNNYNTTFIKLNTSSSDLKSLLLSFENDPSEVEWVQTKFVLHGLKRIAERKLKINSKSPQNITSEKITYDGLNDFVNLCCEVNPLAECYAEDLYNSYIEFYNKLYGGEALSRVHFVKFLKFSGKYKYYRPHHSAKDNRYAFLGIAIDKSKLNKLLEGSNWNVFDNTSITEVESYLKSMNALEIFN